MEQLGALLKGDIPPFLAGSEEGYGAEILSGLLPESMADGDPFMRIFT